MTGENDVLELEISVSNVLILMHINEGQEQLIEDPLGLGGRESAGLDEVAEEVAA